MAPCLTCQGTGIAGGQTTADGQPYGPRPCPVCAGQGSHPTHRDAGSAFVRHIAKTNPTLSSKLARKNAQEK